MEPPGANLHLVRVRGVSVAISDDSITEISAPVLAATVALKVSLDALFGAKTLVSKEWVKHSRLKASGIRGQEVKRQEDGGKKN